MMNNFTWAAPKNFLSGIYKCISESAVFKVCMNANTENAYKFQREEEGKMMNILVSGKDSFLLLLDASKVHFGSFKGL